MQKLNIENNAPNDEEVERMGDDVEGPIDVDDVEDSDDVPESDDDEVEENDTKKSN